MKRSLYFFQAPDNRIKIGISANVRHRLGDVSRTSGMMLALLGSIPGSFALEKFVNEKLASHRLTGEWFTDCDEVRDVIRRLLDMGPDAIGFKEPQPKALPPHYSRERTPEEWTKMDLGLLDLLWPGEGIHQFAAFAEVPVEQVKRWINGEESWPRVYRAAFAAIVTQFAIGGGQPPSYLTNAEDAA